MRKTKKLLSIVLSVIVVIGAICNLNCIAYAAIDTYSLKFDVAQYGQIPKGGDYPHYGEALYKFTLDSYTTLNIDYDSYDTSYYRPSIIIIKAKDYDDYSRGKDVKLYLDKTCDGSGNNYWYDGIVSLYKGSYYLGIIGGINPSGSTNGQNYSLIVTPTVNAVKNLKKTSKTSSVKLTWTGDMGAVGYQIQRKTSKGYKLVKTTTGTSYTAKDLSTATSYKFRVRGYTKVKGKTYYSSWKSITAVTKPSKVSIKTPKTNSKHQIIVKWNKVIRASGYQVQYCKNKNCSNVIATKTISGQSKVSYTGKKFTKNKTYYVRVRAYKTVNNTKYYGAWSSVKSIKCK